MSNFFFDPYKHFSPPLWVNSDNTWLILKYNFQERTVNLFNHQRYILFSKAHIDLEYSKLNVRSYHDCLD